MIDPVQLSVYTFAMKHVHKRKKIIELRAQGLSFGDIARKMKMGKGNVAYYVDRHKRGKKSRQELIEENMLLLEALRERNESSSPRP